MSVFRGSAVAIVTPFREEDESLNFDAFADIIDYQIDHGTDAIVVCGSTGEAATMTEKEHMDTVKFCIEHVAHRVPVIAGTGSNCTKTAVYLSVLGAEYGADGLLLVSPYYNKATQEGLYLHYKAVADAVHGTPVIVYNVPGRTGCNVLPETVARMVKDVPNIVGIKEASGKFEQINAILEGRPEGFKVLSGNDEDTLALMIAGADGVISVASNVVPALMADFVHAAQEGNFEKASDFDKKLAELFKNLFIEPNPIPGKAAMGLLGLMENSLRLPLVTATAGTESIMKETLKKLYLL